MPSVTTIASGTCITCHTDNWDTLHTSAATDAATLTISHVGKVDADGDASCTACHTGTAATATAGTGLPLNAAAGRTGEMVHDTCLTCHDNPDGALKSPPTANLWASAITAGDCDTCHGSGPDYFDSHVHGADTGYINHNLTYNDTVDLSQEGPGTPCGNCHDGVLPNGDGTSADGDATSFNSWKDIYDEHGTTCARCHSYTPDGTPPDFSGRIGARGGHSDPDTLVLQDADCTTTCHSYTPTGIHAGTAPVTDIHGDNCGWCHESAGGGGPMISSLLGLGEGALGCTDCHGFSAGTEATKITGHHNYTKIADSSAGRALSGLCVDCHIADVNQDGALDMPANLPCNFCHLYFPEGPGYQQTGGKNRVYSNTWTPAAGGGTLTSTELSSHTISTSTPPISNYQACFACHGASLYTDSPSTNPAPVVTPFHGFGPTYSGGDVTGGDANDQINVYMNPQHSGTGEPVKTTAIHPGAINFNAIGSVVMGAEKTKPFANDVSPGYHKNDLQAHNMGATPGDNPETIWTGDFTVPWDNFAPGVGSDTININHWFSDEAKTPTYTEYNDAVVPRIPLVPLTITP
jgi:hypothetical protein